MKMEPKMESRLFINGEFVDSVEKNPHMIEVVDPSTEQVFASVQEASSKDVDLAVEFAMKAFKTWGKSDVQTRRRALLDIAQLIRDNKEQLAAIESRNAGKPYHLVLESELVCMIDVFEYYSGCCDKMGGRVIDTKDKSPDDYLCMTYNEPIGVVGQIVPWNFPLLMLTWKLAPVLASGCCTIIKTSEKTPISSLVFMNLIKTKLTTIPNGVINLLSGRGHTTGYFMTHHDDINKIAFTGSSAVGKSILSNASNGNVIKRVSLELGGKSPLIVLPDADIEKSIAVANNGLFFNSGQCCVASSRVFVHKDIYDTFVEKSVEVAKNLCMCDLTDRKCTQGPMIDEIQYKKVLEYIQIGKDEGAKCVVGGTPREGKGYWITPTIFIDVNDSMRIVKEEIFGPCMVILKYDSLEEVVERANDTCYGLGAGICTKDIGKAIQISRQIKAGSIYINCYNVFDAATPFGGFKNSGIGRELGENGLQLYTEVKTVIVKLN